jgi:hypothetical protein
MAPWAARGVLLSPLLGAELKPELQPNRSQNCSFDQLHRTGQGRGGRGVSPGQGLAKCCGAVYIHP